MQPSEIEVAMEIGEHGSLGPQSGNPVKGLPQAEMTGMRRVAQGIHYPNVEALQKRKALRRNAIKVRRIGYILKSKAKRANFAVFELERGDGNGPARAA